MKCLVTIGVNLALVLLDFLSIGLKVVLSLSDSLGELEHLEAEGLDGDDLVRVDIDLLLIAVLVCEGGLHIEVLDSVVVVLWHDWAIVSLTSFSGGLSSSFGLGFDFGLGGDLRGNGGLDGGLSGDIDVSISAEVNSLGGGSKDCKTKNKFHDLLVFNYKRNETYIFSSLR